MTQTLAIPARPELSRLNSERGARLHAAMSEQAVDVLVLLLNSNVSYATGLAWAPGDSGRANIERPVAVVLAGDDTPHLFARPSQDTERLGLPADHLHGPVYLDFDEGVETFAKQLANLAPATATIAVDDLTAAMVRGRDLILGGQRPPWPPRAAGDVIGAARLIKTPEEVVALRHVLWINEQAMADVHAALAPGQRQTDLTALFFRRIFELGADSNILDPIWQIMPERQDELPWTVHGDIACPLLTSERELLAGDVLWVDTGIMFGGYHSDFGRTWIVGQEPSGRQEQQYQRWREINDAVVPVMRAGATGADLTRVARDVVGGQRPWMSHFYLGHGLGLDSAEMPFVGSDLGDEFDAGLVLAAGMILVIEPIVWDEGHSGYRSENVFLITEDGSVNLTDYPYLPYGS
jgi:Xaa-Pro aminopeptidase